MAASSATNPTLLDREKLTNPDGTIADVIEMQQQFNGVLLDMPYFDANMITGHKTTVRNGQPNPTFRKIYGGTQPSKSTYSVVIDTTGEITDYAEIDKTLADLNGNSAAWRQREEMGFVEGFAQRLATTIFYGNEGTTPEAFTGLAPRFNSTTAENADNLILGGGAGVDNASIWLVGWGQHTVHGIVPKGMASGLNIVDKGAVTVENVDGSNGRAEMYRTFYQQFAGMTLRDWRYVVRICNIDKSLLIKDASTGADLPDLMFQAMERMHSLQGVRLAWYMSRTTATMLRRQLAYQTLNSTLMWQDVGGIKTAMFEDMPIRRVDVLAADEALVS